MLEQLYIKNAAVIDEANCELGSGFNVLTGETGAGKSILIDSVNLILGERSSRDIIRHGESSALMQAGFFIKNEDVKKSLGELGIEADDGNIIITRQVNAEGKNVCRINSLITPSSVLKEAGKYLINIHGQHDSQMLLNPVAHIDFLDSFAGGEVCDLKDEYEKLYQKRNELKNKIDTLSNDEGERIRRIEYLKYVVSEIEKANLYDGEEEELESEHKIISNAKDILKEISRSLEILYNGEFNAHDAISSAAKAISSVSSFDKELEDSYSGLEEVLYNIKDISQNLRSFSENLDFDPMRFAEIEDRLSLIFDLKRKYGGSIAEILGFYNNSLIELESLESGEMNSDALKEELCKTESRMKALAQKIHSFRKESADKLEGLIESELADLDMDKTRFAVSLEYGNKFFKNGCDNVEFMVSTNPGEPLKPLIKIASGGELSRIMLAIKSVLCETDSVETMIFDEIDTGVSGRAAQKIAAKLYKISKKKQVICITHLAQIACMADRHYKIEKITDDTSSKASVELLDKNGRIVELCRITDGTNPGELAYKHAEQMLIDAQNVKNNI